MSKDEQIAQKDIQIENLKFENAQLKKLIFGSKSERFKSSEVPPEQLNLFNTPEEVEEEVLVEVEEITYERKKAKTHKGRNKLPDHLPVQEIIIEPEVDTTDMVKIGEEISETLD